MVFLKLVHAKYQVNHKTQPFCVKMGLEISVKFMFSEKPTKNLAQSSS